MTGRQRDLSLKQESVVLKVRGPDSCRLDQYVGAALSWKSRTRIQDLIHTGRIRVNGTCAKPSRKVRCGDKITIEVPADAPAPPEYGELELEILYEDSWLVAINKPPGLLVHPTGPHVYDTLINHLHHRYRGEVDESGEPVRPRLCHRIDKETTGVVVVGKDPYVHNEVRRQFETRKISKEYYALVRGRYPVEGHIEIPIGEGHDLESSLRHSLLRESRTVVRILKRFDGYTFLSCIPATGRQNQIRIHLAAKGFPIVGDERFGSNTPPEDFPQRYLLHSRFLLFVHPRLKTPVGLTAPLPADFAALLEQLSTGNE